MAPCFVLRSAAFALLLLQSQIFALDVAKTDYGVDESFPIQHHFDERNSPSSIFGNDRFEVYRDYINGCEKKYPPIGPGQYSRCRAEERQRIELNINQPRTMTNYTSVGFKKTRLSNETFRMLQSFWERSKEGVTHFPDDLNSEQWPAANTYTNHWSHATKMIPIQSEIPLTKALRTESKRALQEWIPQASDFSMSSLYGVRIYTEGNILASHVDRDPLISSVIINVAQDAREPWPIEMYSHVDGRAHNLTMEPGDMLLYESHSVLHGRPFSLRGRYYANVFVHFSPIIPISKDSEHLSETLNDEL